MPGYELRALIGIGELGEVHRAYQPSVGREVAVRIFGPGMVGHPQFVRRFETASQRITRVEHPHVVPLLDYWREPNRAVMVSRLMTGGTSASASPTVGWTAPTALAHLRDGRVGRRLGAPPRRRARADPPAERAVRRRGQRVRRRPGRRRDLRRRDRRFATQRLRRPGAARRRAGHAGVRHLLARRPHPRAARRLATAADGSVADAATSPAAAVVARATDPDPASPPRSVDELVGELRGRARRAGSTPTAVFVPTRNPYRGLEAFEQADADDFFGRDRAVGRDGRRPRAASVCCSSSVRRASASRRPSRPVSCPRWPAARSAGSETWLVTEMVPGRSPFEQLAAALGALATVAASRRRRRADGRRRGRSTTSSPELAAGNVVVVVIDQFEELFTQTVDDRERRAFLQMLVDVAERGDGRRAHRRHAARRLLRPAARLPGLRRRDQGAHGRARRDVRRRSWPTPCPLPAAGVGVEVEPALVDRITADAELQPGALPLVQHTMAELFARRTTNTITLAAYLESGGLAGAIGRRAEAIYDASTSRSQDTTRRVFLRLVSVSEEQRRHPPAGAPDRAGAGGHRRRRSRRRARASTAATGCSRSTATRRAGRRRSRSPTRRCSPTGSVSGLDRRGPRGPARPPATWSRRPHDWINAGCDASFLFGGGRLELAEAWAADSGFELTHDEHAVPVDEQSEVRPRSAIADETTPYGRRRSARRRRCWPPPRSPASRSVQRETGPTMPATPRRGPPPRHPGARWSPTTTKRCSWRWKDGTSTIRRRHRRTCSDDPAQPWRRGRHSQRHEGSSTSDSRRTARRCSPADAAGAVTSTTSPSQLAKLRFAGRVHGTAGAVSPDGRYVP